MILDHERASQQLKVGIRPLLKSLLIWPIILSQSGTATEENMFVKVPIESPSIVTDFYGALLSIESLSVNRSATQIEFRADNIRDRSVSVCPAVPVDTVGGYTENHFLIDNNGKRYQFKSESQIYPRNWWKARECVAIAPGAKLHFTYEFDRLDPGVTSIELHRSEAVFRVRLLDNKALGSLRHTDQLLARHSGFRFKPTSASRFSDGLIVSVEQIANAGQTTVVTFRAQATQEVSVCQVDVGRWPQEYLQHFIADGTGDHYEIKQDLTRYSGSAFAVSECSRLAPGEVTNIIYAYRQLEHSVPNIEVHFRHNDQTAIFHITILDTIPTAASDPQFELASIACSEEVSLKSRPSKMNATIRFMNRSSESRVIYWLDATGARSQYKVLEAGESYKQITFAGHIWVVTSASGNCISIFQAQERQSRAILH